MKPSDLLPLDEACSLCSDTVRDCGCEKDGRNSARAEDRIIVDQKMWVKVGVREIAKVLRDEVMGSMTIEESTVVAQAIYDLLEGKE